MLLLYIQHLVAIFGLHGQYLGLQRFDSFLVGGYRLMQYGVFPLQSLDLVTSEKRTDTFGYVGGGCCGSPFQFLGLYLFLGSPEFFLCRFFAVLKLPYVCS